MMWRQLVAFAAMCGVVGGLAACGGTTGSDTDGSLSSNPTSATTPTSNTTGEPTSGTTAGSDPAGSDTASASDATETSDATSDASTDPGSTSVDPSETDPSDSQTTAETSTTGEWMPMPCQVEETNTEPSPSNVLLVLDKSGSMSMEEWDHDDDPMTPTVTRWKSLYEVVEFVVTEFDPSINFGAKLFPKYDAGSYLNEGACDVDPGVEVPIASMNAASVLAGIPGPDFEVLGGTPVFSGLVEAYGYLAGLDDSLTRAVVLVADGEISCNESPLETLLQVETAWMDDDIGTYVVGIDAQAETAAQLNAYAEVGGKPNPEGGDILFYQTLNQDELYNAFQEIVYDTISCEVPVDPIPDQPELFEVWIDGQLVPMADDCDDESGWVWSKGDFSAVKLCGGACMDFKVAGSIEAKYWCTPE